MKKRWSWRVVTRAALLVFLFVVMLRWFEHSQVYHPSRTMETSGAALGRAWQDVNFRARDGVELDGWFFPANTNSSQAHLAVLLCHGNGGNISYGLGLYQALLDCGLSVFTFDYRGYGRSQGRPSEQGTYLDAAAAYQWLREKGFSGKDILVYGESLGGGIASEVCLREVTGGLILQSTFTSIPDIGAELYPWLPVRWISTIKYDTHSRLPRIHVPVLILHSRNDRLIPFHHAEQNFAVANEPKLFWEINGGHSDPLDDPSRFEAGIKKFLNLARSTNQRQSRVERTAQ